jgi:potassium/sodium efflux P-type ATPase
VGSIAALLNGASQEDPAPSPHDAHHHEAKPEGRYARSYSDAVDITDIDPGALYDDASSDDDEEDKESDFGEDAEEDARLIKQNKFGKIVSKMSHRIKKLQSRRTPLQSELHWLEINMTIFAIMGAILIEVIGLFRGFRDPGNDKNAPWLQYLILGVSMAVSAIPEGLPLFVVICLALGTKAMAAKNALIRRLPAVETLGSASVICSDKTGTLTSGKMTVRNVWCMQHEYKVSGEGYDPTHGTITEGSNRTGLVFRNAEAHLGLSLTMSIANLCNDAEVVLEDKKWKPIGASTEAALVCCTEKFGIQTHAYRKKHPRSLNVPFSSSIKMMASVHSLGDKSDPVFRSLLNDAALPPLLVCAKGAPTAVMSKCTSIVDGTTFVPLTDSIRKAVELAADQLASQGLRVLGMSCKGVRALPPIIEADVEGLLSAEEMLDAAVTDMVFCGLMCMMDPPRSGVRQAVRRATQGGIRTVMVTGDYLKTAVAIAEMVGILDPRMDSSESAIDCVQFRPDGKYLSHREIDAITWHTFVFSGARPEDKIQIVRSFQRQGFVCAMTGDGVNDAPALRQADIGVAMGLAGSEVAKAASDMILTDDKFISIVDAVELGRNIYINLRKFVMYLIGANWAQIIAILGALLIGLPSPLEPLHILFVNLVTDSMPAIALSIEAPESDVMKERPRKKNERVLSGMIVVGIISHAFILVLLMLAAFLAGLWWELGFVFMAHMYDDDNKLVDVCSRLNDEGTRDRIEDYYCVKEGVTIARTMVFLTLALCESLRPLTARSFENTMFEYLHKNKAMLYAIFFSILFTLIVVFVPGVNYIFHMKPPRWYEWLLVAIFVLISVISDEILKLKFRADRELTRRWDKLFSRVGSVGMELRNLRSHLTRLEGAVGEEGV